MIVPPTISVVIPTYNRARLLINAIESVFAQTYEDYELIVIDDGSTDDTRERLQPYMQRIRYFYQPNRGASAAQNAGIKVARGEWVSILASDDTWSPNKLQRQMEALALMGDEFGACFTDCTHSGDPARQHSEFEEAGLILPSAFATVADPVRYMVGKYLPYRVQSLLVKRSLLLELGGFDEALVIEEDVDLVFRLTLCTRFCLVAEPLVQIDVSPVSDRLTSLYANANDEVFESIERRYRKWLEFSSLGLTRRQEVAESLKSLYYRWAVARLYQKRLLAAAQRLAKAHKMGDSYPVIFFSLVSRATNRVYRSIRGDR